MSTPNAAEKGNWQNREYESFGPHFRIDTGNPQTGYNGTVVYDILGSGSDGNNSTVGMTNGGLYHIYNDQCIEIVGGQRVDGGGVCVNIIGSSGDVTITALSSGVVKITGRNISTEYLALMSGLITNDEFELITLTIK